MLRAASITLTFTAAFLSGAAWGEDATSLIKELESELCDVPIGTLTADPHGLMRELLKPATDEKTNEYSFDGELWVGVWGQRVSERYLIFRVEEEEYILMNCLPFRAMGRSAATVDGQHAESMTFGLYDRTPRGYDMFTAIYTIDSGRREFISAERIDPFLYESGITTWDKPIEDPWYWAEVRFQLDIGGTREHIWGFEIDLDKDGVNELGITSMASHGNAGGSFAFFKRGSDAYRFIGYAELQTIQVLPPAEDGSMRIRSFARFDVNCGSAMTMTNDGLNFQQLEMVKSCDDRTEYERQASEAEVFSPGQEKFRPEAWDTEN